MKDKSKKVRNTDILSAGSKVYAKKRQAKKETVDFVEFNPEKRQTKEKYALLAKEEKLRNRKEIRQERQRLADKNVQEMAAMLRGSLGGGIEEDTFEEEEEEEEQKIKKDPIVQEFKSPSTLTTVTVIEDLELE
ncbi:hypothetical protein BY458DRAFT_435541 [Sporodiniella umbellata]|nr:hypothetical protein BY458DRAFT_435541 [Sporodiniella umbellata]